MSTINSLQHAWMTQSQRARYLKAGGVIAFFVFLFFLISPNDSGSVKSYISGGKSPSNLFSFTNVQWLTLL